MRCRFAIISSISIVLLLAVFVSAQKNARTNHDAARQLSSADAREQLLRFLLPDQSTLPKVDAELASLGKQLFFDPHFSQNNQVSCASCHNPALAFADSVPLATGISTIERNSPTLANSVLNTWFHWDGRADNLTAQATDPLEHPAEHGSNRTRVVRVFVRRYSEQLTKLFGPIDEKLLATLPDDALPRPTNPQLPGKPATYAVSTLPLIKGQLPLLWEAAVQATSPAFIFSQQIMPTLQHPSSWYDQWNNMNDTQKSFVNLYFLRLAHALAKYQETIYSRPSAFDRFLLRASENPDRTLDELTDNDFTIDALAGAQLFVGKAACNLCHFGPNFTNNQFHNTGLARNPALPLDIGRAKGIVQLKAREYSCANLAVIYPSLANAESCAESPYLDVENIELVAAFKTPTLRHINETAPYFHDGRAATLQEVIEFYDQLPDQPALGHREESLRKLNLSEKEKAQLIAFLQSLSSEIYERN